MLSPRSILDEIFDNDDAFQLLAATDDGSPINESGRPDYGWIHEPDIGVYALEGQGNGFTATFRVRRFDSFVTVVVLSNHAGAPTDAIALALERLAMSAKS